MCALGSMQDVSKQGVVECMQLAAWAHGWRVLDVGGWWAH